MSDALEMLKNEVFDFVSQRNWEHYHTPKNLSMSIAIEAAELMQIFQWNDIDSESVQCDEELLNLVNHEMADVMIYCIALSNALNIDLQEIILQKIEYNKLKYDLETVIQDQFDRLP
jgi:NTP pyrophosphatase (non-canonical NTP hydrolase)